MATPQIPQPGEDVNNLAQVVELYKSINSTQLSTQSIMEKIGMLDVAAQLAADKKNSSARMMVESLNSEYKVLLDQGKISRDQVAALLKKSRYEAKILIDQKEQLQTAYKNKTIFEDALNAERKKLGLLKDELKTKREIEQSARDQANLERSQKHAEHVNKIGGGVQKALEGGSGVVKEGISGGAGAIGALIGGPVGEAIGKAIAGIGMAIADIFNDATLKAANLSKASAGIGNFIGSANDIDKTSDAINNFKANVKGAGTVLSGGLTEYGLSVDDVVKKMGELETEGVRLGKTFNEQANSAQQLNVYANVLGMSLGSLGQALVTIQRSTNKYEGNLSSANKLTTVANTLSSKNIMQQGEFVNLVSSTMNSMSELNLKMSRTSTFMGNLAINITKMGGSAATSQKVIGQLMGSFDATSDAWKAFIGNINGAGGGGFSKAYYSTEQAGPGGDITKRNFNTQKYMEQEMKTIKSVMDKQSNPLNKQYMGKLIGQHMGLDETTVQFLMKGINGGNQMQAIQGAMEASRKAEREARPWAEQMADLLKKYVFIPLNGIRESISNLFGTGGSLVENLRSGNRIGAAKDAGHLALDSASLAFPVTSEIIKSVNHHFNTRPGKAGGGRIYDSGPIFAHRGEEILSPNIAEEYRKNKNGNNGNNVINITVNIDADIEKAFDKAKQDTIRKIKRYHSSMVGA